MAFQQTALFDSSSGDETLNKSLKSVSENSTGFCECNICLDSARDPVVTLCGHLYCWPCIYKWLHVQTDKQTTKCPVCKAHISDSSLVPLYGRGNSPTPNEDGPELKRANQSELVIPNRPSAPGDTTFRMNQQIHPVPVPFQAHPHPPPHPFASYEFGPSNLVGTMAPTSFSNPIVGMVGEMVWGMIFRSSDSGYFAAYPYGPYQNPYLVSGASNPRVRRQEMQVEKSLNRLTIFFFCCFMLCLIFF